MASGYFQDFIFSDNFKNSLIFTVKTKKKQKPIFWQHLLSWKMFNIYFLNPFFWNRNQEVASVAYKLLKIDQNFVQNVFLNLVQNLKFRQKVFYWQKFGIFTDQFLVKNIKNFLFFTEKWSVKVPNFSEKIFSEKNCLTKF